MESLKFRVKLVGVIFDPKERKILVVKKKDSPKYSFLEEELSPDEELDKELKRITKERTGFIIHNLGTIYAENKLEKREDMKLYFLCEATEGEEKKGETIEDLAWISPTEAEEKLEKQFPPRLREFIISLK